MKLLLAGAGGNIGYYLSFYLRDIASVFSIDNKYKITNNNFINLDLSDGSEVDHYCETCNYFDVLIFLVGLAHVKGKGKDLPEYKIVNYQTLVNLLSALNSNNKVPDKIIFASTISVYGEKFHQSVYSEDFGKKPSSPYAITKLEAEKYLLDNFTEKSWILRFAPVYSSDFLININRRTQMGGRFYQVGKGHRKLSLCNMENIGAAVEAIIKDKVPTGIYNLSDPKEYTYNELLQWQKANWVIPIPVFAIKLLYYLGEFMNSTFLKENTVKLISDNVFPSEKICSHIDLSATINDVQFDHD